MTVPGVRNCTRGMDCAGFHFSLGLRTLSSVMANWRMPRRISAGGIAANRNGSAGAAAFRAAGSSGVFAHESAYTKRRKMVFVDDLCQDRYGQDRYGGERRAG
jgi:hypothetical protein